MTEKPDNRRMIFTRDIVGPTMVAAPIDDAENASDFRGGMFFHGIGVGKPARQPTTGEIKTARSGGGGTFEIQRPPMVPDDS